MMICSCASEDCAINGCQRLRRWHYVGPLPAYVPTQSAILDEDTLRRLIREEIKRVIQEGAKEP